ncbi:Rne/Rng family ribonuclease [Auritidibacter sp. NML120636]|uniref:Rne/Rng family ribonuclease n=1 Tax=Auritidibacter sp. NML120636 TaxID=2170743 RepID=UPI000D72A053|nr:ribonuclease E/G [Auritidibacter sp. NML120636]
MPRNEGAAVAADNEPQVNTENQTEGNEGTDDQVASLQVPDDPMDVLFHAPDLSDIPTRTRRADDSENDGGHAESSDSERSGHGKDSHGEKSGRSRRKRRGRRRNNAEQQSSSQGDDGSNPGQGDRSGAEDGSEKTGPSGPADQGDDQPVARRRRKRRRGTTDLEVDGGTGDDPENTVTKVRAPRPAGGSGTGSDQVTSVRGSTRLEAKRQRRRQARGRRRRGNVLTEAEFLARRESVERTMMVRQREHRIQIAVLEDGVLAEHFVSNTTQDSLIGNIYLGKVQNVLPSMEAAFIDIGRGRNAVLYAGEVNWDMAQLEGKPKKIENALKSGDSVLVQVTKDPVGHKGARLTSQISLPGRYLVYVPGGSMTGISRKLPDTERSRLKKILKDHMPDNAGVIVRTAAEGTSEQELMNDINRLRAQWEEIESASTSTKVLAPEQLHAEPDLTIKVVRDVFNEDFTAMVVQGDEVWDNVEAYVTYVAPHLVDRLSKWDPDDHDGEDLFASHRLDEQLHKALDRKVNLPSGGSLIFDRTEAMTVVDVNTGKFTGSGGNLEETVTKNNLEAAEEIVRQLRLRDIGGIIVIDFIDMVLESNRDLVLRRLVECLGRDRTRHQVAEVTSLGLVQMTRKRMGTGLVEVFSETCEACAGRGIIVHDEPVEKSVSYDSHGQPRKHRNHSSSASDSRSRRKNRKNDKNRSDHHHHNSSHEHDTSNQEQHQREEQAERDAKAEQTRNAMNSIAAASNGSSQQKGSNDQQDEGQCGKGEQNSSRGRRGRKPRRADSDGAVQSQQSILDDINSALDDVQRAHESQESQHASTPSGSVTTTDTAQRAKPRRRRATSDVGAETVQTAPVESTPDSGAQFTARSTTSSTKAPKESTETKEAAAVMLGVGVSAEDISSPQ